MAYDPCARFQELLDDLVANIEDPEMLKLGEVEHALLSAHVKNCQVCTDAYEDALESIQDDGLHDDAAGQLFEFLYKEDTSELADFEEAKKLINVPEPDPDDPKN